MPLLFLLLSMISSESVQSSDSGQTAFVGCLSRLPEGTLQLGTLPSGKVYSIQGNTESLIRHVNQLVRVLGRSESNGDRDRVSKLTVSSVQVVGDTCTAGLPPTKAQTVVGKVGEDQVAIPVTTTASDQITPGFQTEAAMIQLSGPEGHRAARGEHPATPPYAPLEPEQAAQSESAANINAEAAARAEILPANTLGVSGALRNAPAGSRGASSNRASSMSPYGARVVVVDITGEQVARLSPQRVSIRAGETIQWKNHSTGIHEIIANPAKSRAHSVPSLPTGARPFESGFLRPDYSFSYRFTVPGIYHYVCDLNGPQPVMGEIVVAP